jgi:integrase
MSFMHNGRTVQTSTKCTSVKKARQFQDDYRSKLRRREIGIEINEKRPSQTFEQAVNAFLASLVGEVKSSTIAAYKSKSKMPVQRFGKKLLEGITREDLDSYKIWRQTHKKKAPVRLLNKNSWAKTNKPISNATVNRERTLIAMVLNYALPGHWQSIAKPAGGRPLKMLREDPECGEKFRVISREIEERYLNACSQPLRDVATIILDTGLRPHEVLNLRPEHVDFEQGFLSVVKSKTKAGKRDVPMTQRVRAILYERASKNVDGWIFPGGRAANGSLPITKLTNSHLRAIDRANRICNDEPVLRLVNSGKSNDQSGAAQTTDIPRFRLYDCRHTWATRMVQAGCDLMTLKALGGWSSLSMIERYAHPTKQHQADAIRRLERLRAA